LIDVTHLKNVNAIISFTVLRGYYLRSSSSTVNLAPYCGRVQRTTIAHRCQAEGVAVVATMLIAQQLR
jgi:hypothetical protein